MMTRSGLGASSSWSRDTSHLRAPKGTIAGRPSDRASHQVGRTPVLCRLAWRWTQARLLALVDAAALPGCPSVGVAEALPDELGPGGLVDPAVAAGGDEFEEGIGAGLVRHPRCPVSDGVAELPEELLQGAGGARATRLDPFLGEHDGTDVE